MSRRSHRKNGFFLITSLVLAGLLLFGPRLVRLVRGDVRQDEWARGWQGHYRLRAGVPPRAYAERPAPDYLILQGAKERARKAARFDASYRAIPYPWGDVPDDRGACTDVIVRSLRNAGIDLQQLIHEDMRRKFSAYPNLWGLSAPDPNIDHRRTPNQMCYLSRYWLVMGTDTDPRRPDDWKPGDLVYWHLPTGSLHCGVVSDHIGPSGLPMVIHNLSGCREEDYLARWRMIAHFRHPHSSNSPLVLTTDSAR